jgi:hypothetical protein
VALKTLDKEPTDIYSRPVGGFEGPHEPNSRFQDISSFIMLVVVYVFIHSTASATVLIRTPLPRIASRRCSAEDRIMNRRMWTVGQMSSFEGLHEPNSCSLEISPIITVIQPRFIFACGACHRLLTLCTFLPIGSRRVQCRRQKAICRGIHGKSDERFRGSP